MCDVFLSSRWNHIAPQHDAHIVIYHLQQMGRNMEWEALADYTEAWFAMFK